MRLFYLLLILLALLGVQAAKSRNKGGSKAGSKGGSKGGNKAGNVNRELINFNKASLGNLAALDMMIFASTRYNRAHVFFKGVHDIKGAAGNFYAWHESFGRKKGFEPMLKISTYGHPNNARPSSEWYEKSFVGNAQFPQLPRLDSMKVDTGVLYDVYQTAPISLGDHRALSNHIFKYRGSIGYVYVQSNYIQPGSDDPAKVDKYLKSLEGIYEPSTKIVVMDPSSFEDRDTFVPFSSLDGKLPAAQLEAATHDPFVATTLLQVDKVVNRDHKELRFLPQRYLNRMKTDDKKDSVDSVLEVIQEGLKGYDTEVHEHIQSWILRAEEILSTSKEDDQEQIKHKHLLQRLEQVKLKFDRDPIPEGEVDFADPLFAAALLSNQFEQQSWSYEGPSSSSGEDSSHHGNRGKQEATSSGDDSSHHGNRGKQEAAPSSMVKTFSHLPRDELLAMALEYFSKQS